MVAEALQAAEMLKAIGLSTTVWDVRSCLPLDPAMLADAAEHLSVITVEDGIREGGIGMMIAEQIALLNPKVPVTTLGVPTRFIAHATSANHIHAQLGLDATGITEQAQALVAQSASS
jgi:1-deoxy-D-xylulose-5-phosphate synthase